MPWASVNVAPAAASEVRYGASGAPMTASASSFSNTTTRTCSGVGTSRGAVVPADDGAADEPDPAGDEHAPTRSRNAAATSRVRLTGAAPGPPTARGQRDPRP